MCEFIRQLTTAFLFVRRCRQIPGPQGPRPKKWEAFRLHEIPQCVLREHLHFLFYLKPVTFLQSTSCGRFVLILLSSLFTLVTESSRFLAHFLFFILFFYSPSCKTVNVVLQVLRQSQCFVTEQRQLTRNKQRNYEYGQAQRAQSPQQDQ